MIPRMEKAQRKHEETLKVEAGQKFFDAPYGSNLCSCGAKVVAQGRCQECYDNFIKDFADEAARMTEEVKDDKNWCEILFNRKMKLIRI